MKITHEKTKALVLDALELIKEQAKVAKTFKTALAEVETNQDYSELYKKEQIEKLRTGYIAKYNEAKEKISEKLNAILDAEVEQENILEFDVPEFSNTLAAINASEGKLPYEVIDNIKINFAGQYQALNTIVSALKRYGIDLSGYGYENYLKSASNYVSELQIKVENIELSKDATLFSLRDVFDEFVTFAETRGIKLSSDATLFIELSEEEKQDFLTRRAMGLE